MRLMTEKRRGALIAAAFFLFSALMLAKTFGHFIYQADIFADHTKIAGLNSMMSGTAERPYVYRQFLPQLTLMTLSVIPDQWQEQSQRWLRKWYGTPYWNFPEYGTWRLLSKDPILFAHLVYLFWVLACFVGFAISQHQIARVCYPGDRLLQGVVAGISLFICGYFFSREVKLYDPATVLFSSLYLLCLVRREWVYAVFCMGLFAMNRETALVFLLPAALAAYGQMEKKQFIGWMGVQAALALGILAVIRMHYAPNPGFDLLVMLFKNLTWMTTHVSYTEGMWITLIAFLVCAGWYRHPPFLRQAFAVMAPLFCAAYIAFGMVRLHEIRVFLEIMPFVGLFAANSFVLAVRAGRPT